MSTLDAREDGDALVFSVRVAPRASRSAVLGVHDGALKVALTAPPVDGAANAALIAFLAKALGVAKRDVTLEQGETSRTKRFRVVGATLPRLRALADGPLRQGG
ncbi:MAG: YggU family protein [Sandaracinaceae bacterium]|nr:YggU family protein [Sandaracinaceae bacterium]